MWENLADETIIHIMSYLRYYDIVAAGSVCKRWNILSQDELMWKRVLTRHFNLPLPRTSIFCMVVDIEITDQWNFFLKGVWHLGGVALVSIH